MAHTINVDIIDRFAPSKDHSNIPIINKPNPCYGYTINAKELYHLMHFAQYYIYEAGTNKIINGVNYYDYFPEEQPGGGGGGGVTSYSSLTEKPEINNHTLMSGNNTSSALGLQTKLTTVQLTAVNSGITSSDVEQIKTNKNDISTVIMKKSPIASGDLNNVTESSYAIYTDVVSNKPTTETWYIVKTSVYDNNIILQEATALNANAATYTRIKRSGNWQAWKLSNLNDTQLAAVNSGINSTKVDQITTNASDISDIQTTIGNINTVLEEVL